MQRSYPQKSSLCRRSYDSTKIPLLNKTNQLVRKSSTISVKKTIKENKFYHHSYLTKKKLHEFCSTINNDTDSNNKNNTGTTCHIGTQGDLAEVDPAYISTLRHEAYDELHRQMQQYNDSFVIRMQQAEQQRLEADQRPSHHRRRSLPKPPFHRRRSSLLSPPSIPHSHSHHPHLHYCHQVKNEPGIDELVDMLETGTIKDYSLLTEWELCQNPRIEMEEEQHGGFGDLW